LVFQKSYKRSLTLHQSTREANYSWFSSIKIIHYCGNIRKTGLEGIKMERCLIRELVCSEGDVGETIKPEQTP
jgi:hypothetical protein